MLNLNSSCGPSEENFNLEIKKVRVRSMWLCHGSLAAPGSLFSGSLTTNPLTHWWVEIETVDSNKWFCAQFNAPYLELTLHSSRSEVTKAAERCIGREGDNPTITNKAVFRPSKSVTTLGPTMPLGEMIGNMQLPGSMIGSISGGRVSRTTTSFNVTMGDVYNWMKEYDSNYDLISNNCQDFGDRFSVKFGGGHAANNAVHNAIRRGAVEAIELGGLTRACTIS